MKRIVIILSLIFALAISLSVTIPALADTPSGTTAITGSLATHVEISVPAGFALPELIPGQDSTSAVKTVTVNCNKANWTLAVKEDSGDGKMSDGGNILANALKIKGGDVGSYTALSGTDLKLKDANGAKGTVAVDNIYFQQSTTWDDVAGSYAITVTFTVTPS